MNTKTTKTIWAALISASPAITMAQTSPDQIVCLGDETEYTISNAVEGSSYKWNIESGGEQTRLSSKTKAAKVSWDKAGNYKLSVQEINEAGCEGPVAIINVQVQKAPSAEFDNALLCYGEQLSINLSGTAPFDVEYTIDGSPQKLTGIKESKYELPKNIPGKYALTKVTDKTCSSKPKENSTSTIGSEMKALTIKH